jgi:hypothetical protein
MADLTHLMSTVPLFPFLLTDAYRSSPVNKNDPKIAEIFSIFIPMHIAALEMLPEHNLVREIGPGRPRASNASIITMLLIDFLKDTACEFDIENVSEIVRAADEAGLKLEERKEVGECDIGNLRAQYEEVDAEEMWYERVWKDEV